MRTFRHPDQTLGLRPSVWLGCLSCFRAEPLSRCKRKMTIFTTPYLAELLVAPACVSGPCKNGGKCIPTSGSDGSGSGSGGSGSGSSGSGSGGDDDYTCICPDGYTGDRCETGVHAIYYDEICWLISSMSITDVC